jgi:hypothetical protein
MDWGLIEPLSPINYQLLKIIPLQLQPQQDHLYRYFGDIRRTLSSLSQSTYALRVAL